MKTINLDITHRCTLECPRCTRQQYVDRGEKVPGKDMSVSEFSKILDKFQQIRFCGNISDPVFNPNFITFLEMCYSREVECVIHHAATGKSLDWYRQAFAANPKARWYFGIDGIPEDSHKYRKNQNGPQLFKAMVMCKEMGLDANWAYILFRYNENDIDAAKLLADKFDIQIYFVKSSRFAETDPLKPLNRENYL